ncbi:hypothetical protein [Natronobacterium gregoryi]|uniref:PGF-pre-PGF domain-containing protein n=2 Tax=Natronobacterium gregoryi TaxID=44930 RepID=L0AGZ1_NATGS|nr:hypothetical protein [Natronobacterium gregoryi]AFZ73148.1 hypothetical protein Natgr_1965 [Natronobacterium gregoryi SP2]PLK21558.1 hypothetical protein CYV19_03080 [Natronobacterium gregoryi SP2]SFI60149.1 hypothetical protein SAMN05443661_102116 [Natronobacterium gregoryi]
MSRRGAFGIAILCLLLLIAAATGGTSPDSGHDRVFEGVTVEPHDGPHGAYASLDGDDELVIDLAAGNDVVEGDGVPAETVTGIDDVVRLNHTGDESVQVWLEHGSPDIAFYRSDDTGTSIEGEQNRATLGPDDSIDVGFTVDSRDVETVDVLIDGVEIHGTIPDGSGGVAGASGPPSGSASVPTCPPPTVTVEMPEKTTREVSITNAADCGTESTSIDLRGLALTDGVTLERITAAPAGAAVSFAVSVDRWLDANELRPADETEPIGAVTIEDAPAEAFETIEYHLVVDHHELERDGTVLATESGDAVPITVHRYEREGWAEIDVERVDETEGTLEYTVPVDPESDYVVSTGTPETETDGEADDAGLGAAGDGSETDRDAEDAVDDSSVADRSGFDPADGTAATIESAVVVVFVVVIAVGLGVGRLRRAYR